ncbi:hypothetical protein FB45DRAFT_867474 [Roridomyces roridus]|uniref:Uncharacterized protein n=1 Tax=Roridomyces roridus TaxID=1738132 RepID=A0AAD7BRW1_9AGAR|nr:hypothetical protein FB45DRAFT_867474 [Roridomyces roridus]
MQARAWSAAIIYHISSSEAVATLSGWIIACIQHVSASKIHENNPGFNLAHDEITSPGLGLGSAWRGLGLGPGKCGAQAAQSRAQARASGPSRALNITTDVAEKYGDNNAEPFTADEHPAGH